MHYLKDLDSAQEVKTEALPIVVKELVSIGPGMCTRIYRMTIETNGGQIMGTTDLANDIRTYSALSESSMEWSLESGDEKSGTYAMSSNT